MPVIYTILYLFFDEKRKTIKRKRRAKESPKMAVIVDNLNIRKSKFSFNSKDKKNQPIKATLYRFLTSKGLNKDSVGLSKLTKKRNSKN